MSTTWAIGVDMGGTFIDVVACASDGRLHSLKHPRTQGALVSPILDAVERLLAEAAIDAAQVVRFVHGSTVVTNLLLEQDAPPVAVITGHGLGDVLALARQDRQDLYAPTVAPPTSEATAFPAHLRFEIDGRLDAQGREVSAPQHDQVVAIARQLQEQGVASAAVCLLFSHLSAVHERQVAQWLRGVAPGLMVSLSSAVDPRPREFERFHVTAHDAYVKPTVQRYLTALDDALRARGLPAPHLMRAEGGIAPWSAVMQRPIALAMSGPCAALQGVCSSTADGIDPVLMSIDVGGTSTDIGLIQGGRPTHTDLMRCGDLRLRLRCADVEALAIGGGSVATVNAGGGLRLGPRSQGASPGPACYGMGGDAATLTDALRVLDRLPAQLAGGVTLDGALARAAIDRDVGLPLQLGVEAAARAVVAVAASTMAEAVKMRAFERNLHPGDCVLVAAGGGGAQHAAEVAELAGIARVRVIPHAGVVAALGLLAAAPTRTVERACCLPLDAQAIGVLRQLRTARDMPTPDGDWRVQHWSVEVQIVGQGSPVEVPWRPDDDPPALWARFAARYEALRGPMPTGARAEVLLLRGVFEQAVPSPALAPEHLQARQSPWLDCAAAGTGPRRIDSATTTVWVPAGWRWRCLDDGALELQRVEAAA